VKRGAHLIESQLAREQKAVLLDYLNGGGEAALKRAYELARRALAEGLGVLAVVGPLHEALLKLSPHLTTRAAWVRTIRGAEKVLVESLTPFEMTHRGFLETNAALRVSEARYRELFENANDIAFTTDLRGNFTSINRAGERLTGYSRAEVLSLNISHFVPPEYVDVVRRLRRMARSGNDETAYELEILTKDGHRVPLEAKVQLIRRARRAIGMQGIARDITLRRYSEQALRRVNERLEQRIKAIAHALHDEAGQLLVQVHLALADTASQLPPEQRQRLERISAPLDQAAAELRRLAHELRPVILDDLGLLPAFEFLAQGVSRRTGLRITVEGSLHERLAPEVETALYRILQEALTNANKHARATRVAVQLRKEGRRIICTIRDDGTGFDPCAVSAQKGRPCLGLLGIRERLAAFGGTLSITSSRDQGTTLTIQLLTEAE
jgi:PAS domain S-box-containing protein